MREVDRDGDGEDARFDWIAIRPTASDRVLGLSLDTGLMAVMSCMYSMPTPCHGCSACSRIVVAHGMGQAL